MREFVVEQILDGYLITAFPIAIIAGVISFLSPCVLPLVPGYISYAAGFSKSRGRVLLGSILFVLGFSLLFISYGALFGGFGAYVFDNEKLIISVLGAFTILLGLIFIGVFPFSPTYRAKMPVSLGLLGAPVLGFLFGVGWTPCIGPALLRLLYWFRCTIYRFRFIFRPIRKAQTPLGASRRSHNKNRWRTFDSNRNCTSIWVMGSFQ